MKVTIHLAEIYEELGLVPIKQLCTVDLEVVPGGTYEVDGEPYIQVGRPVFHITKHRDHPGSRVVNTSGTTHTLVSVDLYVKRST